jgi:hypothetical protein
VLNEAEQIGDSHSAMLQTGLEVLGEKKTVLGRLGKSRSFLQLLIETGNATSEVSFVPRMC